MKIIKMNLWHPWMKMKWINQDWICQGKHQKIEFKPNFNDIKLQKTNPILVTNKSKSINPLLLYSSNSNTPILWRKDINQLWRWEERLTIHMLVIDHTCAKSKLFTFNFDNVKNTYAWTTRNTKLHL